MAGPDRVKLQIEPLTSKHDRKNFSCGVDALDRYIRQQASQDVRKNVAAVFVMLDPDSSAVVGFYTLSATSISLHELPGESANKIPRYPHVPAILLGRLAMDQSQRGKGYGELLLLDAFKRCLKIKEIGWLAMVVEAKDEAAVEFYQRYYFIRFSKESNCLFLPHTTIAKLMGNLKPPSD